MLPIDPRSRAIGELVAVLARRFQESPTLTQALEAADLQPTETAAHLAAQAAIAVLLAHDLGQTTVKRTPKAQAPTNRRQPQAPAPQKKKMYLCPTCNKPFQTRGRLALHEL